MSDRTVEHFPGEEEHWGGCPDGRHVEGLEVVNDVGEDVDALLHGEGEGVVARTDVVGNHLRSLYYREKQYTLRRPVMREVLSTRIWGVPPACLGSR